MNCHGTLKRQDNYRSLEELTRDQKPDPFAAERRLNVRGSHLAGSGLISEVFSFHSSYHD
jgi:hypothetical protein